MRINGIFRLAFASFPRQPQLMLAPFMASVICSLCLSTAEAQNPAQNDSQPPKMIISMKPGDTHLSHTSPQPEGRLSRWLELQTLSISSRYRYIENSAGATAANQNQYQIAIRGRFKLDAEGKYSIHAGLFSGNNFSGGWNRSGWGTGAAQTNLFLKQLYFSAKPVKGVELQYGGLNILHGESTDLTGYAFEGYIVGQRLSLTRPKEIFFDEVSVTYGYLGDTNQPGLNKRFHRLKKSNYHQFLLAKTINNRVKISGDYTSESGIDTLRQAVKVQIHETRAIDALHFENYQRLGADGGYGFAVYGEKKIHQRLSLGGGYAQIEHRLLNADRIGQGKRFFATGLITLSPEFSISVFATRAIADLSSSSPRTRIDVSFNYNLLRSLRKTGFF